MDGLPGKRQPDTFRRLATPALLVLLAGLLWPAAARSEKRPIDVSRSVLTVHVFKSGLFSLFAHNHEIKAPIAQGRVELSGDPGVELQVDARRLRVLDPELSEDTRAEVQQTMAGPAVLDSSRFPEIRFQSGTVEPRGAGHWTVHGNLSLHGQTRPVAVEVRLRDGHYQGSAKLKQRDFGITPVSVAGGAVKVKDEVEIAFDIVLGE